MKSKKRAIAAVFNYGPHYRQAIYQLMAEQLEIDIYLGDRIRTKIKPLDTSKIPRFKAWLRNRYCGGFYWQQGLLRHFFSYHTFLFTGEIKNLSSWTFLLLSKLFGKRMAVWTHGWQAKAGRYNKWVQRVYFSSMDVILTYSERARALLIAQGISAQKIHCIYNSLAYEEQLLIREQLTTSTIYRQHFGNELPVLLFIGRLEPNKKIEQLLQLLALLQTQEAPVNLILIGGGPEEEKLKQLCEELNLQQEVWFYGPTYQEAEIGELLYNADLCVSPGNVGLTAMHALMYGLPVASHNDLEQQMPEVEAIVEGQTGFCFEPNNLEDLATKLQQWLKLYADSEEQREQIRSQCYRVIDEKYNPYKQLEVLRVAL